MKMILISPKLNKAFLIWPDLIEEVGPCPMLLNDHAKCSQFTQMFLILPKTRMKFYNWPKFDEGFCNFQMILVHLKALTSLL